MSCYNSNNISKIPHNKSPHSSVSPLESLESQHLKRRARAIRSSVADNSHFETELRSPAADGQLIAIQ